MKSYGVTIQVKPLQQDFHMVLFIWYVDRTFEFVDEILWYDYSSEASSMVLFISSCSKILEFVVKLF